MKIIFLGTGTSVSVPMIGCKCTVCKSDDPHNKRRRSSLYVEAAGTHIVIDTPPDFREQALQYDLPRVDAVVFTHSHADHTLGFDDIRRFNTVQNCVIPAFASPEVTADLMRIFDYIHTERKIADVYRPRIDFRVVSGPFDIGGVHLEPLPVVHGEKPTQGYLLQAEGRRIGYVPDCLRMGDDIVERLNGVDLMILDALRDRPHLTHLTLEDSLALLKRIGARQSYIIHMCHELEHSATEKRLPESVGISFDGLTLTL